MRVTLQRQRGFTLVELMIAIALLGLLMALAAPSFSTWIRNSQVRSMSQTLANGVRVAQSEAVRRNRLVVFFLTNTQPGLAATAAENGVNWVIRWVPMPGDTVTATAPANEPYVEGGAISDVGGGVGVTGPAAICFNAQGRRVAATAATTGVTNAVCTVDAAQPLATYDLVRAGASRALRVTVSLGGQVRMCDPARPLSAAAPDGCPA